MKTYLATLLAPIVFFTLARIASLDLSIADQIRREINRAWTEAVLESKKRTPGD